MTELERKVEALVRCVGPERVEEMLRQIPEADKPMRVGSRDIEDFLTDLGIPSSLVGFDYLVEAVELRIANSRVNVVEDIYGRIAMEHGCKRAAVERALRHIVCTVYLEGDIDLLDSVLRCVVGAKSGNPTVKEFIDRIARVIMRRREG